MAKNKRTRVQWQATRLIAAGVALFSSGLISLSASAAPSPTDGTLAPVHNVTAKNAIPGSYIVVLKDKLTSVSAKAGQDATADHVTSLGGKVKKRYSTALNGFSAQLTSTQLEALRSDPNVDYIEADKVATPEAVQTLPGDNSIYHLDRIDQKPLASNQKYQYTSNGTNVDVYILDSGIRTTHTDFGSPTRVAAGYNATADGTANTDCLGHGTHVAGLVGSATYGVAKNVKLIPVKVFECTTGTGSTTDVVEAVNWVTAQRNALLRPSVANMSLTVGGGSPSIDTAVTNSIAAGVAYAVAAGNTNVDACTNSPARVAAAVTVGGSNNADAKLIMPSGSLTAFGTCIDLFAPGHTIRSTYNTNDTATALFSGTSTASPIVAGSMALYMQRNPSTTPATIAQSMNNATTTGVLTGLGTGDPNKLLWARYGRDTNIGIFNDTNNSFYLRNSNTNGAANTVFPFGVAGITPISGDWDGNGTVTVGTFSPGSLTFTYTNTNAAGAGSSFIYGPGGDPNIKAITGDWDGNGTTTIGVYIPSTRTFFLKNSMAAGSADITFTFGTANLTPVAGDWNGDGITTVGTFNANTNTWSLTNTNSSAAGLTPFVFGPGSSKAVTGDWDGNGTTTIGTYTPSPSATFNLRNTNSAGAANTTFIYSSPNLKPVVGDWDGN